MAYGDEMNDRRRLRNMDQPPPPDGTLTEAAPGAQKGTGFVNLAQYLQPNMAAGQQMAQGVADETARQGDAARSALAGLAAGQMVPGDVAGRAQDAAARARLAGPGGGGLQTVLSQDFGRSGPYTSGMSGFDALLAGGAGGRTLAQSANAYGGLGREVDAANKAAAAYVPPPAAAPAGPAGGGGAAAPAAPAGGGYYSTPQGMSPLTYSPESGLEGSAPAARNRNQQIDPGAMVPWWKRMGGR